MIARIPDGRDTIAAAMTGVADGPTILVGLVGATGVAAHSLTFVPRRDSPSQDG